MFGSGECQITNVTMHNVRLGGGAAANTSFDACTVRGGVCVGTVDPCPPCFTKRPDHLVPAEDANHSKPIKTDDSEISATAGSIRPTPQMFKSDGSGKTTSMHGWAIGASASIVGGLSPSLLANATAGRVVGGTAALPATKFVALGLPAEDATLRKLAAKESLVLPNNGSETYILAVGADSILILANAPAGVFWGVQSLLQLGRDPAAVSRCVVHDWPDFQLRGAYMYGAPKMSAGGLAWNKKLVDWMVKNKMSLGVVVTEEFYDLVPGVNTDAKAVKTLSNQMRELRKYMEARFVEFVPTLGSGATANTAVVDYNPATAEGIWVRNRSFTFDVESNTATAGSIINNTQLNGDFARLGPDQRPSDWVFQPASGTRSPKQWAVVEADAPPQSRSGRSMRCEMKEISCTVKTVTGGCSSAKATSPAVNITGGSVLQVNVWAKLTAYSWGGDNRRLGERLAGVKPPKGPQFTVVPTDANGGSQLLANMFLNPTDAAFRNYNISEWRQYTLVITVSGQQPYNSALVLYHRLAGCCC